MCLIFVRIPTTQEAVVDKIDDYLCIDDITRRCAGRVEKVIVAKLAM